MVAPSAPQQLSAEATNTTTAELRWSAPENDGGFAIDFYNIFRSLNGGAFLPLTTVSTTAHSDTTLSAQDNAAYQVSATNLEPLTSPVSNTASTTTATSEAQIIKQLLFNNWSLTGELAKDLVPDPTMTEVVHFYDRGQVPGNKFPKAITVQKINELGNENIVEHPKFFEQSDTFEITCFLQVIDSADDQFSVWIDLMQQMTSEVTSILRTQFAQSSSTGEFFRTNLGWTKDDTFFPDDPELTRRLRFTLTRILSNDGEVFLGYPDGLAGGASGVLVFDTSASTGDNKPEFDYSFEQVTRIELDEGFTQIPILTKDKGKGVGVPQYVRGIFNGTFSALMFAKKTDIVGSTIEKIENIYKPQSTSPIINQNAQVVLLQANINTESTPVTLTVTSTMIIDRVTKVSEDEQLLTYRVHGVLTKPSEYAI